MKAPDKIYAGFDENTHLESYCTEKKGKCQTEYIRKDALLEWAKDLKHVYEIPVNNNHQVNEICCAKAKAFQTVIDKIESL